jgi:Helix-turn-helix domain
LPNMPRKEKADPGKYEGKAYLTYEEAMDYLGIRRSSLYSHITEMGLEPKKFRRNRLHYLTKEDVERIEKAIETPWVEEQPQVADDASDRESEQQL